jgi:hypothetical protein
MNSLDLINEPKKKNNKKSHFTLKLLLFIVIALSFAAAGFIGKHFLSFFIFYMFFTLPLIIVYSDFIITLIPNNIANYISKDIHNLEEENEENTDEQVKIIQPIKNKEYFILFLGVSCFILSQYLFIKHYEKPLGLLTSFFFCILSNIIISDFF